MGVLTVVSLFSGCGGLDFGANLCGGFRTISYCEAIPYRQACLMSQMRRGGLDTAPVDDDVRTFDARGFRGCVDVVAGGDPCQPHSLAGKRKGLSDERWLWPHFRRIIEECRPRFVLRENVPGTVSTGGLIAVLEDLERLGYKAAPYQISAAEVGAWHLRKRIFIIAHLDSAQWRTQAQGRNDEQNGHDSRREETTGRPDFRAELAAHTYQTRELQSKGREQKQRGRIGDRNQVDAHPTKTRRRQGARKKVEEIRDEAWRVQSERLRGGGPDADSTETGCKNREGGDEVEERSGRRTPGSPDWWVSEPGVGRVVHGCPHRVDRIGALGDIVVPQQAVPAWRKIKEMALS